MSGEIKKREHIGPEYEKQLSSNRPVMKKFPDIGLDNPKLIDRTIAAERAKKNPPEVIPMTERDAKIINSKEFKKASERTTDMKKGGKVKAKCMASGGKVSQLAKANGIAVRGKSRGKIC